MDYLQYVRKFEESLPEPYGSFKPCYKWITFNTEFQGYVASVEFEVLNLVINGLPSIL